jgi:hypothetical protein
LSTLSANATDPATGSVARATVRRRSRRLRHRPKPDVAPEKKGGVREGISDAAATCRIQG